MNEENKDKENDVVSETGEVEVIVNGNADAGENKTQIPHVENIEHIGKVEITENIVNQFLNYFPHLVVGAINILVLLGMGFMLIGGKVQETAAAARGLITFLVVLITIAIALILTLLAFFSNSRDLKERFALGKEILTLLIGVLGTIIGFYFGSAERESAATTAAMAANSAAAVIANSNKAPVASTPINANTASYVSRVADKTRQRLVAELEVKGFNAILAQDFDAAAQAFGQAYQTWDIYHNVEEINQLLQRQSEKFTSSTEGQNDVIWSEIYCEIATEYQWGMPSDIRTQFQQALKSKNYLCTNNLARQTAN
jgi:hypothetical protein